MTAWAALAAFWWYLPPAVPYDPPLPAWDGRVYTAPDTRKPLHIGIRPASDAIGDYAVTIQVSADVL